MGRIMFPRIQFVCLPSAFRFLRNLLYRVLHPLLFL